MRVVIADPPAYTPWYDHELAAALGRAGAEVELHTSHFRFAELPPPERLRAGRALLSALVAAVPALAGPAAAEGRRAPRRRGVALARLKTDVLHVQWLAVPQVDVRLRFRSPSVFTAHDLLPRRTAEKRGALDAAASAASIAWSCTPSAAARRSTELGVEPVVIPHPVYPSEARPGRRRADDPRARRDPAVQGACRRGRGRRRLPDARLLVAGDPAMPLDGLRDAPRDRVAARLSDPARARPGAVGGDRRDLPVPRRARPVGRTAPGARRRRSGGRLRRRRARRADREVRRGARRARRRRRGADRGRARPARGPGGARRRARRGRAGPGRAAPGTRPRRATSSCTGSS